MSKLIIKTSRIESSDSFYDTENTGLEPDRLSSCLILVCFVCLVGLKPSLPSLNRVEIPGAALKGASVIFSA